MHKTALVSFLFLFSVTSAVSQYRIGGINTETVFEKIPAGIKNKMDSIFGLYQDSLNKEYEIMQQAANLEVEKWMNCHDCPPPPDSTNQSLRIRLINIIQNVNNFQEWAERLIQKRRDALKAQFFMFFKEQVRPIAFECGYDIIIDLCTEKILPMPACTDITGVILQKLKW